MVVSIAQLWKAHVEHRTPDLVIVGHCALAEAGARVIAGSGAAGSTALAVDSLRMQRLVFGQVLCRMWCITYVAISTGSSSFTSLYMVRDVQGFSWSGESQEIGAKSLSYMLRRSYPYALRDEH